MEDIQQSTLRNILVSIIIYCVFQHSLNPFFTINNFQIHRILLPGEPSKSYTFSEEFL